MTRKYKTTTTFLQRNNNSIKGINDFSKYNSVTLKKKHHNRNIFYKWNSVLKLCLFISIYLFSFITFPLLASSATNFATIYFRSANCEAINRSTISPKVFFREKISLRRRGHGQAPDRASTVWLSTFHRHVRSSLRAFDRSWQIFIQPSKEKVGNSNLMINVTERDKQNIVCKHATIKANLYYCVWQSLKLKKILKCLWVPSSNFYCKTRIMMCFDYFEFLSESVSTFDP